MYPLRYKHQHNAIFQTKYSNEKSVIASQNPVLPKKLGHAGKKLNSIQGYMVDALGEVAEEGRSRLR